MKNDKITRYPIFLVHGMGIRDFKHINSWGRIPSVLRNRRFTVFQGNQDANGTIEDNAAALKETILNTIANTNCEKVNIIAHSKGGLDARFMITHLVVKCIEGENDGLLTPDAVKWGDYIGPFTGNSRRGISHFDEVDLRRRKFTLKNR